jgi:hypothetical protein
LERKQSESKRRSSAIAAVEQWSSDLDVLKSDDTAERANMASVCASSSLAGGLPG